MRGRFGNALTVAAIVAAALAAGPSASAATVSLNCDNRPLQPKLDSVAPGTVLLLKGTCDGAFVVTKNITLKGNPTATLDANGAGRTLTVTGTVALHLRSVVVTGGATDRGGGIFMRGRLAHARPRHAPGQPGAGRDGRRRRDLRERHGGDHPRLGPARQSVDLVGLGAGRGAGRRDGGPERLARHRRQRRAGEPGDRRVAPRPSPRPTRGGVRVRARRPRSPRPSSGGTGSRRTPRAPPRRRRGPCCSSGTRGSCRSWTRRSCRTRSMRRRRLPFGRAPSPGRSRHRATHGPGPRPRHPDRVPGQRRFRHRDGEPGHRRGRRDLRGHFRRPPRAPRPRAGARLDPVRHRGHRRNGSGRGHQADRFGDDDPLDPVGERPDRTFREQLGGRPRRRDRGDRRWNPDRRNVDRVREHRHGALGRVRRCRGRRWRGDRKRGAGRPPDVGREREHGERDCHRRIG